jgi:urease accessory protein
MVSAKRRDETSVIRDLRQAGSLKALFPRTATDALDLVFLNTAGGMTGGDVFEIETSAERGSRLTVTTQAAERIYGAVGPVPARLKTCLDIAQGARLDWLPQETILFDQAALRRTLDVNLAADATFLMVEPLIFGRKTMGEAVRTGYFADDVRVRRDGALVFADAVRLSGDMHTTLQGAATTRGSIAFASVLYVAPDAEVYVKPLQTMLPASGGVSLIREGVLFARIMAPDSYDLRHILCPVMSRLHGGALPKTWML